MRKLPYLHYLMLGLMLIGMTQQAISQEKKKLSREEKKLMRYQEVVKAMIDTTFSFTAQKMDLPTKNDAFAGSIVMLDGDRVELLEIWWPKRPSGAEMITTVGEVENLRIIDDPSQMITVVDFETDGYERHYYITITNSFKNGAKMVITDRKGYALTTYYGDMRAKKKKKKKRKKSR